MLTSAPALVYRHPMPKTPISPEEFARRQTPVRMAMRRDTIDGVARYMGCCNPYVVERSDQCDRVDDGSCFFRLDALAQEAYRRQALAWEQKNPGQSVRLKTGCRMDCRPYTRGRCEPRIKVVEAWRTVSDDGLCQPATHFKTEFVVDAQGVMVLDREEETGCPYFRADVRPEVEPVIMVGWRG